MIKYPGKKKNYLREKGLFLGHNARLQSIILGSQGSKGHEAANHIHYEEQRE